MIDSQKAVVVLLAALSMVACRSPEDLDQARDLPCELAVPGSIESDHYAPLRLVNAASDSEPNTSGVQTTIEVRTEVGVVVNVHAVDDQREVAYPLGSATTDEDGLVRLSGTLAEGRQHVIASCQWSNDAPEETAPVTVYVDTVPPVCAINSPIDGATIGLSEDTDPDAPLTQLAVEGLVEGDGDVAGETALFATGSPSFDTVAVTLEADGIATAFINIGAQGDSGVSLSSRDHAGNTCEATVGFYNETDGCQLQNKESPWIVSEDGAVEQPGIQAVLAAEVDVRCAGQLALTTCDIHGVRTAVVSEDGSVEFDITVCDIPSCSVSYECETWVSSRAGYETQEPMIVVVQTGSSPAPVGLTPVWEYVALGYTDAIALAAGPTDSSDGLVVVVEDPDYEGLGPSDAGGLALRLDVDGALGSSFAPTTGGGLMGIPLAGALEGDMGDEYIVCQSSDAGRCYAVEPSTGTASWQSSPLSSPGFWNKGASTGRIGILAPAPPRHEIVLTGRDGEVMVLDGANGDILDEFSTWDAIDGTGTALQEGIGGHAAIADVVGNSDEEIVLAGLTTGRIIALGATGAGDTLAIDYLSDPLPGGQWVDGSGPAIGDLDGDGEVEIVVATAGAPEVYAYSTSHGSGCKFRWSALSGTGYYWTAPVIGDVDGDGHKEVVVMSGNGMVSILGAPAAAAAECSEGVVEWEYQVAGGSESAWFTPALAQLAGTNAVDVVVATYSTLEVLDVQRRAAAYRFHDPNAAFYPSAVVSPGIGEGGASIFVSGWSNGTVYRIDTPAGAPRPTTTWGSYMGNNGRTGAF